MDSTIQKYAMVKFGPYFGLFSNEFVYTSNLEGDDELVEYKSFIMGKPKNIALSYPDAAERMKKQLYAYLQAATGAIAKDKIYRKLE